MSGFEAKLPLGISVNAEGGQTEEQRRLLVEEGCGELQFYLFSQPQPGNQVATVLARLGHSRASRSARARLALALS